MIIKRNTHAPFRLPRILINHEALRYEVEFTESCRYRFGTDDDADVNKLFGIAFITWGSFWFVIKNLLKGKFKALHHYNSVRFGWRYDALSNRFELLQYSYVKGHRLIKHYTSVNVSEKIKLGFSIFNFGISDELLWNYRSLSAIDDNLPRFYSSYPMPNTWLCYELKPYFGGNNPAPHDMEIKMKRI